MTEDKDAQEDGLRSWIHQTGFPIEHQAGEALRQVGYAVEYGSRYAAESTRGARETDVIGREPMVGDDDDIEVVIEAKHIERPWVVRLADDVLTPVAAANLVVMESNTRAALALEMEGEPDDVPFVLGFARPVGFAIVEGPEQQPQAHRSDPFPALQAAVAAARARQARRSMYEPGRWASLPVIVVDGALWTVRFQDSAEASFTRVEWHRIRWAGASDAEAVLVDVVTLEGLEEYARRLRADTQWLAGWMKRHPRPPASMWA